VISVQNGISNPTFRIRMIDRLHGSTVSTTTRVYHLIGVTVKNGWLCKIAGKATRKPYSTEYSITQLFSCVFAVRYVFTVLQTNDTDFLQQRRQEQVRRDGAILLIPSIAITMGVPPQRSVRWWFRIRVMIFRALQPLRYLYLGPNVADN
jgi:hypothetical protein